MLRVPSSRYEPAKREYQFTTPVSGVKFIFPDNIIMSESEDQESSEQSLDVPKPSSKRAKRCLFPVGDNSVRADRNPQCNCTYQAKLYTGDANTSLHFFFVASSDSGLAYTTW